MKKIIKQGLVGVAIATVLALANPAVAHAATNLGGLSVQTACSGFMPGSTATVKVSNVTGWRCVKPGSADLAVGQYMMSWSCLQQYGGPVSANYLDYNNPYSWRCFR